MKLMKIKKPENYYLEDYLQDMREEMENLYKNVFDGFSERITEKGELISKPPVELLEKNGNYELKAQLPGMNKEDIEVEVQDDSIRIKAEKKEEKKEENENLYRSEFRYGKFERRIPLPSEIKSDEAHAEYKDGILKISAPKAKHEEQHLKKLKID